MAVGPHVGVGRRRRRRSILTDSAAIAYVAAMSVAPSPAVAAAVQTFIGALKADGPAWSQMRIGYLMHLHTDQASRLNMIAPASFALADVGAAPTWASGVGGAGGFTAGAAALTTGFDLATDHGGVITNQSLCLTVVSRTAGQSATGHEIGEATATFARCRTNTDSTQFRLARATSGSVAGVTDGSGIFSWCKSTGGAIDVYRNGASIGTTSLSSDALNSTDLHVCGVNGGAVSSRRISAAFVHGGLAGASMAALHVAIAAFDTAIGAS